MDTVLLVPGLFNEIASLLDNSTVNKLKQQSTDFRAFIDQEQEFNAYWKPRVQAELGMSLPVDIILDWKEVYRRIRSHGLEDAVASMFPPELLLNWVDVWISQSPADDLDTNSLIIE